MIIIRFKYNLFDKIHCDKHNFLICGNTINKAFVYYYLKHILGASLSDIDKFKYTALVIDSNADMHTFDHNGSIIIGTDNHSLNYRN